MKSITGRKDWNGWCSSTSCFFSTSNMSPAVERRRQSGLERRVLEVRALHLVGHFAQAVKVDRAVDAIQVGVAQAELLQQEFHHALRAVVGHFEPHRVAEVPVEQLALQGGVQVLDLFLVDEQVGVARHAELVAALDLHAREQLAHVRVQDRGQEHERVLGFAGERLRQADHARQRARRLHDRRAANCGRTRRGPSSSIAKFRLLLNTRGNGCAGSRPIGVSTGSSSRKK